MRAVEEPTRSQSETLRQLVLAIERLAGAKSTKDVVETLRSTARSLVGADGICIVLRDNGKCHYVEEDAIKPLWKGGKFPMPTCISGWAMINKKTAVIPDVFVDDRIPHAIYRETFVKSLVMTPIGRDEPIAALGAYWARNYAAPPEVVDTLETLARAAATALENAYLYGALNASLVKMELARDDLRHRLGNALSAIESFADASLAPGDARDLKVRVQAIERAHKLVGETFATDGSVLLGDIVAAELAPYRDTAEAQIELSGGDVSVSGAQALAVALLMNELAIQASRSGSLKSSAAGLAISWRELAGARRIEWKQTFATTSAANAVGNLGSRMVRGLISAQLGGVSRQVVNGATVTLTIEFASDADVIFPANAAVA